MDLYRLRLHGGLGDGFKDRCICPPHLCLPAIKEAFPEAKVIVEAISNSKDMQELYKYHPLVDEITYTPETEYIISLAPIDLKYDLDFTQYKQSAPKFYLTTEEETLVSNIKNAGQYVFIHPYSSTPRKQIATIIDLKKLVDYIIDHLELNVVLFGKSHEFDEYSRARGYPSCTEVLDYERSGLYNFSHYFLSLNNPRTGWHLLAGAHWALVAESAYLQAATYLNKRIFVLLGPGLLTRYQNILDNFYFIALRRPGNVYMDSQQFTLDRLDNFNGTYGIRS
jgi:hypothetical protein